MAARERVLSALNFITGEGITYYPDSCNGHAIEALITDYFSNGNDVDSSEDESDNEIDHSSAGSTL